RRELRGGLRARLHARQQRFSQAFSRWVRRRYGPLLEQVLRHRYLTLGGAIALLILTIGYVRSGRMGIEAMPRVESDYAVVTAVLPYGSPVERTIEVRDLLEAAARAVAEQNGGDRVMTGIYSEVGREYNGVGGSHVVEVRAYLPDPNIRPIGTRRFADLWRQSAGRITGLDALIFESDRGGPGSGASLTVELSHPDNAILGLAGTELATALQTFPIVSDIDSGFAAGKEQFDLRMRPEAQALGLTAESVALQMRSAFFGTEALRQQRGRNEVKVMVRLPGTERYSEQNIETLLIRTPSGRDVPLREVAEVTRGRAYTVINRRNSARTIQVTANVSPPRESPQIQEA
ncbi:MAG: efflux RND transporter permease subunit, partial [Kiritimatiellia bacterium]|nr:efflux RND transporter permease subunit [Kiritimatiellia bacterium]